MARGRITFSAEYFSLKVSLFAACDVRDTKSGSKIPDHTFRANGGVIDFESCAVCARTNQN